MYFKDIQTVARFFSHPPTPLYIGAWLLSCCKSCSNLAIKAVASRVAIAALGMLMLLGAAPPLAAQTQSPEHDMGSIREIVQKFVHTEISKIGVPGKIEVGQIDQQLRLSRCAKVPEVFFSNSDRKIGHTSVGVRCNGEKAWTIYVPVRVGVFARVTVVSRALPRGHVIASGDIRKEYKDLASLVDGYLKNPQDAVGKSLSQSMTLGAVVTPLIIQPARSVRRGDRVTILASRKGVEVRMAGVALADGVPGARIKVRNITNSKIVQGVVTKHGEVQVKI